MAEYSCALAPAEILRYRMMASRALNGEADLWDAAGITSNAAVVDLGCGPGIFLPGLASRTLAYRASAPRRREPPVRPESASAVNDG